MEDRSDDEGRVAERDYDPTGPGVRDGPGGWCGHGLSPFSCDVQCAAAGRSVALSPVLDVKAALSFGVFVIGEQG